MLLTNQGSVLTEGQTDSGVLLVIYDDESRTRIRPAFGLGVGATFALTGVTTFVGRSPITTSESSR
jgi:hypothetical protein